MARWLVLGLQLVTATLCTGTDRAMFRSITQRLSLPMSKDPDGVGWMRSVMGGREFPDLGPYLLLDHWGGTYGPHEAVSGSDHPHRGQATVSYILKGGIRHEDSAGNSGTLTAGDVQWMNAGNGVMHSEMHHEPLWEHGGDCEGFQLWVNLRAEDKASPPDYQDTPAARIPVVQRGNASVVVKVIAGRALGVDAVIKTKTPQQLLDVAVGAGLALLQPIPKKQEGFVYVFGGGGWFGGALEEDGSVDGGVHQLPDQLRAALEAAEAASETTVVHGDSTWTWADAGDALIMSLGEEFLACCGGQGGVRLLLLSGEPLGEPISRYGPFVMNTRAEIDAAFGDYQRGQFGVIPGKAGRDAKRAESRRNINARLRAEAQGHAKALAPEVGPEREARPRREQLAADLDSDLFRRARKAAAEAEAGGAAGARDEL